MVELETKEIEAKGQKCTIRRFSALEQLDIPADFKESVFYTVFIGTVNPKFSSIDEAKAGDWEYIEELYVNIQEFNNFQKSRSFLERLKSLQ